MNRFLTDNNIDIYNKLKLVCSIINDCIKDTEFYGNIYIKGGCLRNFVANKSSFNDIDIVISNVEDGYIKFGKLLCDKTSCRSIYNPFIEKSKGTCGLTLFTIPELNNIMIDIKQMFNNSLNEDINKYSDFTCNSLYMNTIDMTILDITNNGINDIKKCILKMVHENNFKNSPIRIVRLLRFCNQLNFIIDKYTLDTAIESIDLLEKVDIEWIKKDLNNIIKPFNDNKINEIVEQLKNKYM